MNTEKSLSFHEFFKFELGVSLFLLLFAFLVEVFISLIQGVIIWDEYTLLGVLFFGFLYSFLGVVLGLFSTVVGYLTSGAPRQVYLKFFGIAFPSVLVACLYLTEAIHPRIALLFPEMAMTICYGVIAVAASLLIWAVWRFWLRKRTSAVGIVEFFQGSIIFLALLVIWVFSMDVGFIKDPFDWPQRLLFASAWLGVFLLGFPLVRIISGRLTRYFSPPAFTLSRKDKLSVTVFLLLAMGYCFVLAERFNPHSPDKYAIRSHAVSNSTEKPNVFLFILDTFRADQLFDYGEEVAPNLTALFRSCVVFKQAYSPSSWTLPATRSIFSSLYSTTARRESSKSQLALHTLPEMLAENGYRTVGFTENHIVTGALFAQGFDRYYALIRFYVSSNFALYRWMPYMPQKVILTCLRAYDLGHGRLTPKILDSLPNSQDSPLFLYVHFNEAHYPYYDDDSFLGGIYPGSKRLAWYSLLEQLHSGNTKLEVEPEDLADMLSRYRQGIESLDRELGHLFESLRNSGFWDNSLIIITSDHGEEFLEHFKWGHGQSLYQELIHVPLLMEFPQGSGITPRVVESPVNIIDIAPTVLDFLGLAEFRTEMQGESLLPLIRGESGNRRGFIFSERIEGGLWHRIYTTIQDSLKFILNRYEDGGSEEELYNLARDPGEKANLWRESEEFLRIKQRSEDFIDSLGGAGFGEESEFDPQTMEKLKAMGYLW